jgi:O-antigen ligase
LAALLAAAYGSVEASPSLWACALVLLWVAYISTPTPEGSGDPSLLLCAVGFFAAWIVATNIWANPGYTAAAPYHAGFLVGGVLLGRRAGRENAHLLFATVLIFALGLAGWAMWQRIGQGAARAQALFETPATLTSTINLVLLPGLVLVAWGKRNILLVSALVLLGAAFAAAASRGGWLALGAGGLAAFAYGRRAGIRADRGYMLRVVATIAAGWAAAWLAPIIWDWAAGLGAGASIPARVPEHSMIGSEAAQSFVARRGLYELALHGISLSPWHTGYGYLGFYYLMEVGRQAIPTYGEGTTYFVHNDYLQTLLELGIPGLAGLLVVVVWPFVAAWRTAPSGALDPRTRLVLVAAIAALGSMAAHALVDFPFYIPVCLLIYGAALGVLDSIVGRATAGTYSQRATNVISRRLRRAAIVTATALGIWVLLTPVAAELAAAYAQRQLRTAHSVSAAYWFEVARRIEPRDWRYCWYAGQFWYAQALQSGKPEAARLADQAFADGFSANPREARNLLGRIATHRRLRALLPAPADAAMLLGWVERAVELAPNDRGARAERTSLLEQFGPFGGESAK